MKKIILTTVLSGFVSASFNASAEEQNVIGTYHLTQANHGSLLLEPVEGDDIKKGDFELTSKSSDSETIYILKSVSNDSPDIPDHWDYANIGEARSINEAYYACKDYHENGQKWAIVDWADLSDLSAYENIEKPSMIWTIHTELDINGLRKNTSAYYENEKLYKPFAYVPDDFTSYSVICTNHTAQ